MSNKIIEVLKYNVLLLILIIFLLFDIQILYSQTSKCLSCHRDSTLTIQKDHKTISLYVNPTKYKASVHGENELDCTDCHSDLADTKFPHTRTPKPVVCTDCHDDVGSELQKGPHGSWTKTPGFPSKGCVYCHGNHYILSPDNPNAPTNVGNSYNLCGKCHSKQLTVVERSVHGVMKAGKPLVGCTNCHTGHNVSKPNTENKEIMVCAKCHSSEVSNESKSVHARAALKGNLLAPTCITCHTFHNIQSRTNPNSPISTMNIPFLCGRCHHEGSKVSLKYNIPQKQILKNYSLSIHGQGLFKMGLKVTAVCTSCHNAHLILDYNNPESSINPLNVAKTCSKCHSRIEKVHVKVIEGKLWEKAPHEIPACTDCHPPHKIRLTPINLKGVSNKECFRCHSNKKLTMDKDGKTISLYIDKKAYDSSTHVKITCAQCHTQVKSILKRPCDAITKPVDCSICHADVVAQYKTSIHGKLAEQNNPDAPKCITCHNPHKTQSHLLPSSPTFATKIPKLCGQCHSAGKPAAKMVGGNQHIVKSYINSVHGKGLLESGLVVAAKCTDCHTAHHQLSPKDPESSVNPKNLANTCGKCHKGIEDKFKMSIHWPGNVITKKKLPVCETCHSSHNISRINIKGFRTKLMYKCGNCHKEQAKTYFETVHGQVSRLGEERAAKCWDCHGTHRILPPDNPLSTLSYNNELKTCGKCHQGVHREFAGYLTHATHHNRAKYPYLFYSFWFMTILLVGTLSFFIIHNTLWLRRLWQTREQWRVYKNSKPEKYFMRFSKTSRIMHLIMLLSFFTLAITGMTLKFSYTDWAVFISNFLGGFRVTEVLHRIAAVTLIGVFIFHLRQVARMKKQTGKSWLAFIFGEDSLMFNLKDVKQFMEHIKWYFGKGEKPKFGRFSYWEKFDYFAVFWGVFIIGGTGLLLWFPVFFTYFLPGWIINVATIIHSDEALLAVGFIFTIHFFNTHFRPDKFPLDPVIFSGRVSLEELKHDKPLEYERFVKNKDFESKMKGPISKENQRWIRIFGFTALGIGLALIVLIIYAMIFVYR